MCRLATNGGDDDPPELLSGGGEIDVDVKDSEDDAEVVFRRN
jgi:hypothetical protein